MGGKRREPTTKFVDYALDRGYKIIRETRDRRRVQMRHSKTHNLIILPLYADHIGRDYNHYKQIERGMRKAKP